ncbi:MAG: DNA-binding protein WhiA [Firmicutes bacterium]|nr:DNA-binding protein WhiA [Bacillota bacterium]
MSFASEAKSELTHLEVADCCAIAELQGLSIGSFSVGTLRLRTESAAIARRFLQLAGQVGALRPTVSVTRGAGARGRHLYQVCLPEDALTHRKRAGRCDRRAFLRGAFLAVGSVSDPHVGGYHLELAVPTAQGAKRLENALKACGISAHLTHRRNEVVFYIKEGETIASFLQTAGASHSLLAFEDVRIVRSMKNRVNRLVNAETANLEKSIAVAVRQREAIERLDAMGALGGLPAKLQEVARLRLRYPEATLAELGRLLPQPLSKSTVGRRLAAIEAVARDHTS